MTRVLPALLLALGLTLYVTLTPGVQYVWDGAAVAAWLGVSYEIVQVIP